MRSFSVGAAFITPVCMVRHFAVSHHDSLFHLLYSFSVKIFGAWEHLCCIVVLRLGHRSRVARQLVQLQITLTELLVGKLIERHRGDCSVGVSVLVGLVSDETANELFKLSEVLGDVVLSEGRVIVVLHVRGDTG